MNEGQVQVLSEEFKVGGLDLYSEYLAEVVSEETMEQHVS